MDSGREFGFLSENIVQIIPGTLENGGENQGSGSIDTPGRANEDDYKAPNTSNPNYDQQQTLDQSNSGPPFKKSRHMQSGDSRSTNRSKVMGQILFKTKLCCKFQTGICPYTNCNFAHGLEELRVPPPNWQEIVAAATVHEEDCGGLPAEVIGSSSFSIGAAPRSRKWRACKRFNSVEGCPFGDYCKYVHDKQFKERESVVISLGPTSMAQDGGSGGGGGDDSGGGSGGGSGGASWMASRLLNWKTRICNKWEQTGNCPLGNKCNFAHGFEELHRYGGGRLIDTYARDPSAAPSNTSADPLVHRSNIRAPSQGPASITRRTGRKPGEKWKGPDRISLIYGDWIGDLE